MTQRGRLPAGSCTLTGYLERVHPEDRDLFTHAVRNLTPEASSLRLSYRMFDDSGGPVSLQVHVQGRFRDGVLTGVTGIYAGFSDCFDLARGGAKISCEAGQVLEALPEIVWVADASGRFQYTNLHWEKYSGLAQFSPAEFHELVHPDDRQRCCEEWSDCLETGKPYEVECRLKGRNSEYCWFLIKATAIPATMGQISCWIGICSDIHRRKHTELSLETLASEEARKVNQALSEKTVLLKEVHHRVKNNLAVVSSLLGIAADNLVSEEQQTALKASQNRLLSIALVHEQLYNSDHFDYINFADYATELAHSLYTTVAPDRTRIRLELFNEPLTLGIHRAMPCGLILNELITNAFKYAFPDNRQGAVNVVFRAETSGNIIFMVSDDGVGLATPELTKKTTTGLRVVEVLTKQIDGTFRLTSTKGTTCEVIFPQGSGSNIEDLRRDAWRTQRNA